MTFFAALCVDRINAPFVLDEPASDGIFRVCVEQFSIPVLPSSDLVIMDKLSCRAGKTVRQAILPGLSTPAVPFP